jgi:hypothetical protein
MDVGRVPPSLPPLASSLPVVAAASAVTEVGNSAFFFFSSAGAATNGSVGVYGVVLFPPPRLDRRDRVDGGAGDAVDDDDAGLKY